MNKEEFIKTHCLNCGTQRCEGIDSTWFNGCEKKWDLDGMNPAAEIKRLNDKIMELAREIVNLRSSCKKAEVTYPECPYVREDYCVKPIQINTHTKPIKIVFEGQFQNLDELINETKVGYWEIGDQ